MTYGKKAQGHKGTRPNGHTDRHNDRPLMEVKGMIKHDRIHDYLSHVRGSVWAEVTRELTVWEQ